MAIISIFFRSLANLYNLHVPNNNPGYRRLRHFKNALAGFETVRPFEFTDIKDEYQSLWKIRKELFPAVGAVRETGDTRGLKVVYSPSCAGRSMEGPSRQDPKRDDSPAIPRLCSPRPVVKPSIRNMLNHPAAVRPLKVRGSWKKRTGNRRNC